MLLPGACCFFAAVDVFHAEGDDDKDHDGGGDDSDDDDDDDQGHSSGIDEADGDLKGKVYWMETTNLPEWWSREGSDSCVACLAIVANCEVMWQRGWCHAGGPTQGRPNPCIFWKTAMEVDPMKSEENMSKNKDACKLIELHLTNS